MTTNNTINNLIEIVNDPKKKKLRARSIQDGRWVRFPNKLRKLNAVYLATKMTPGNGESWIAGGEITPFPINKEKNEELENILGIKNKALLKSFYDVIFNEKTKKANTEMLNLLFLVKKIHPNIDEQLLLPMMKEYQHSAFVSSDYLIPLQNMLSVYNEKRIVSIFSAYGDEEDFLEDTVIMYERLFEADLDINNSMPEKPKNIRELHTLFTRESSKIKHSNNQLKQKLNLEDNQQIGDYRVFIPKTSYDLINIGNTLSICVGNGYYAEKILKKKCSIVSLIDKNNKPVFCIEFTNRTIIQARGRYNDPMNSRLVEKFQQALSEKKVA